MTQHNPGAPKTPSPASAPETRAVEADYIPMDVPLLSLAIPEHPEWHLHWALGKNVPRMMQAGYTLVTDADGIEVNNGGFADSKTESGSTDQGSNISVVAGSEFDPDGQPERLYLMKLPRQLWEKTERLRFERNERVAAAMRAGVMGADKDPNVLKNKLKQGQDLFIPKRVPASG